jgi:hyaluronan synthase
LTLTDRPDGADVLERVQHVMPAYQHTGTPEPVGEERSGATPHAIKPWPVTWILLLGIAGTLYVALLIRLFHLMLHASDAHPWSRLIARPSVLWASMGLLLIVFRTVMWFRYRPTTPAEPATAPPLTVIIPAFNEGSMVERTVESVATALYPEGRLEIIVVDDGSTDDTWQYIDRAARRHPGLVIPVRFARNQGKRAALAEGFRRGRGDIFVTIDSDSEIEPATLLAAVGPFADPRVGAVAGKVTVYNRDKGLIPKMLHVRYILSFDFLRAVQSTYGTVYCCPGALAAYRAAAVGRALDAWMGQTFLGARCTYGEDRSMTNFILAQGYDTVYQRNAVVHTIVPVTYWKLCKMFLRWDRSYIREELRFARIVWSRPLRSRVIALFDAVITNLRYPVGYACLGLFAVFIMDDPATFLRVFVAIGLMSMLNMIYYLRSERSWNVLFGVLYAYFSSFTLFWIFPYALLTARARSWLTR